MTTDNLPVSSLFHSVFGDLSRGRWRHLHIGFHGRLYIDTANSDYKTVPGLLYIWARTLGRSLFKSVIALSLRVCTGDVPA